MSRPAAVPADLQARYREGRLVPFVGAGASMSVTWEVDGVMKRGISWSELVNYAASMLGFGDPDLLRVRGTDLQILEYFREKKGGELAGLRNWFAQTFRAPDEALSTSPIHTALANMTLCPVYYTTNYDDYLERALRLAGRPARPLAVELHIAEALKEATQTGQMQVQVVKFHGDLENPQRMVLSESDYERRLKFTDIEDRRLTSDLIGRAMLFVGYSFSDWNVSYLFRLINEQLGPLPGCTDGTTRLYYRFRSL